MVQKAKMKVLLTGASGFIGKNFLEYAPKNMEIIAVYNKSKDIDKFVKAKRLRNVKLCRCDFTNKNDVNRLAKQIGYLQDNCIYLAGNVNIPLSIRDPAQDIKSNVIGLINFLEAFSFKKFIYMSSAAVYEGNKGIATTKLKLNPYVPYSISKLIGEHYVMFFHYTGKIGNYIILRFGGAYGRYSPRKFVSQLVEQINLQNRKTIEVYGDGSNIVNLMHAKDAIKALLACLKSKKSNIVCNLGQHNMTITELVSRVAKIFNKKVQIKYTPKRKDQKYINFELKVDFSKIFNFKPDYSFEKGIKEFGLGMKNEN